MLWEYATKHLVTLKYTSRFCRVKLDHTLSYYTIHTCLKCGWWWEAVTHLCNCRSPSIVPPGSYTKPVKVTEAPWQRKTPWETLGISLASESSWYVNTAAHFRNTKNNHSSFCLVRRLLGSWVSSPSMLVRLLVQVPYEIRIIHSYLGALTM